MFHKEMVVFTNCPNFFLGGIPVLRDASGLEDHIRCTGGCGGGGGGGGGGGVGGGGGWGGGGGGGGGGRVLVSKSGNIHHKSLCPGQKFST